MRDDNGGRIGDAGDMELVLSQFEFVWWVFSPAGLITVAVGTAVLLSGLPGAILPNVEMTASARRTGREQQGLSSAPTRHDYRETMDV